MKGVTGSATAAKHVSFNEMPHDSDSDEVQMEIESGSSSPTEMFELESLDAEPECQERAESSAGASSESASSENVDMPAAPSFSPSCSDASAADPMGDVITEQSCGPDFAVRLNRLDNSEESLSQSFGSSSSNTSSPRLHCEQSSTIRGNLEPGECVSDEISASQASFGEELDSEENTSQCSNDSVIHRPLEAAKHGESRQSDSDIEHVVLGGTDLQDWRADIAVNLHQDKEQDQLVEPKSFQLGNSESDSEDAALAVPQPADDGTFCVSHRPPEVTVTTSGEFRHAEADSDNVLPEEADVQMEHVGMEQVHPSSSLQFGHSEYAGEDVDLACAAFHPPQLGTLVINRRPPEDDESSAGASSISQSDIEDIVCDGKPSQHQHAGAVVDRHQSTEHKQMHQPKSSRVGQSDSDSEDVAFVGQSDSDSSEDVALACTEAQPSHVAAGIDHPLSGKQDQTPSGQCKGEDDFLVADAQGVHRGEILNAHAFDKQKRMIISQSHQSGAYEPDCEEEAASNASHDGIHITTAAPVSTDSNSMLEICQEYDALTATQELLGHHSALAGKPHMPEPGLEQTAEDGDIDLLNTQSAPRTLCSPIPKIASGHHQATTAMCGMPSEEAVPIPARLSHIMKHFGKPDCEIVVDGSGHEDEQLHVGMQGSGHSLNAHHQQIKDVGFAARHEEVSSDDELTNLCPECVGLPWLQPSAMDSLCGHIALFARAADQGDQYVREELVDLHVWLLTRDHEELLSSALLRQMLSQRQARKEIRELQKHISKIAQRRGLLLPEFTPASRNQNDDVAEASRRVLLAKELTHILGSKYVSLCEVLSEVLHQQPELANSAYGSSPAPAPTRPSGLVTTQASLCHQRRYLEASLQACDEDAAQLSLELEEKSLQVQQVEDRLRNLRFQMAALRRRAERRATATPTGEAAFSHSPRTGPPSLPPPADAETSEFLRLRSEVQALRTRCSVRRNLSATFEQVVDT